MGVLKFLWTATAACLFFTGCVSGGSSSQGEEYCTLSVILSEGGSRTSDDPGQGGVKSEYDGLAVCFTDGNKILFCDTVYDRDEVDLFKASGKVYENVTSSVSNVFIMANVKSADAVPLEAGISCAEVERAVLGLASQQPDAAHPENTTAGGLKVTLSGKGKVVVEEGANVSGPKRMKAEVTLKPVVARLEIYGMLRPGVGIRSIKVDKLYLNGYYARREFVPGNYLLQEQNIYTYEDNLSGDPGVFTAGNIGPGGEPLHTDAHHLFTDGVAVGLPHIVLEVSGIYADASGKDGDSFSKRYLTVNSYANAGVMACGNIYKVNLSLLTITPDMLDPVPEAGRMTLKVSVGIEEWNEHTSFPEV